MLNVIECFAAFEEISINYMMKLPVDEAGNENVLVVIDNFKKCNRSMLSYFL